MTSPSGYVMARNAPLSWTSGLIVSDLLDERLGQLEFIIITSNAQQYIALQIVTPCIAVKDGGTALLAACQYGHMKVVETLLKHGANIHDQLYDGATALFLAAQGGFLDLIRLLLSSGAKVNQPRQDGTAPLWIASQMGHSEVVRVMLLRGADRDAARNDGTTALLKAANKGYSSVIEELLKFSPALGLLKNGTSALHAAVVGGNIRAVALLLEAGADPFLRNKKNELPSDLTKNERILRLLQAREKHTKS
ncbi:ankyrin repeat domain-containing protein 29 isoform X2 [Hemicordylus capensis]|uniref:ankyrin repeat domain-containing protein 29 isoform X2 n=1 Tax=Hemicordylus capensis TaxID=884348 RepID=UPI0023029404|nr:ankyrin repeat domain-containing protein 29 isoform X2 [Hemicordylus capensis]XP_053102899.1 ankyrin repeat domain-containing protein 29 isoform X2 [Hemicordylus capensis]XP_053102901.1 ankyrin repeat domain-containing protein 29 isoform X2 [Hemicordylus capensis]XP_053102902.1 ankyrin repeat domain-containing protein 29 isoform X2 [Hemicordylus capensis]